MAPSSCPPRRSKLAALLLSLLASACGSSDDGANAASNGAGGESGSSGGGGIGTGMEGGTAGSDATTRESGDEASTPYAGVKPPASHRVTINLGQSEWKFLRASAPGADPKGAEAPSFDDSSWTTIGVPHSWNDSDTFINQKSGGGDGSMTGGNNWYRKHFKLDPQYAGRKILIEFEGAHFGAQVYINGQLIKGNSAVNPDATHVIGFVPFLVDVTDQVKFDGSDNVLAVRVGRSQGFYTQPWFSDVFRFGQADGGLFRPVSMHVTDKIHVPQNVYSVLSTWGTYVATVSASAASAEIEIQTNVLNESGKDETVTMMSEIVDAKGEVVATAEDTKTVAASASPSLKPVLFDQKVTVANPALWFPNNSPYGKPNMYQVFHIVKVGGAVVDAFVSPLGIRTITWNKDFPLINGQPHFLWGASGRYDYPALGSAVPAEQQWRDVKLTAAIGGSLWRPGHSTSSSEFVEACDAYGVMIVQPSGEGEGAFNTQDCLKDAAKCSYNQTLKSEVHRDMIVRDRNHPSILSWEANNGPMDTTFAKSLKALSQTWDPVGTRAQADRTPNAANGDILGCTMQGCEVGVKRDWPDNPAWGSEYWGRHSSRFAYDYELDFASQFLDNWRKGRQVNAFGIAHWYLAETPGEIGDYEEYGVGSADRVRSFGSAMMDMNRIPKLLYHVYHAAWTPFETEPFVALAHHWNRSGNVRVNAFSNCPKVRLLINGQSQGEQVPNPWTSASKNDAIDLSQNTVIMPFQTHWDVTWAAGTLRAECLDATGNVVAFDEKATAGPAAAVVLLVEPALVRPSGEPFAIEANGSDAAFVLAKIVDANGLWVPTASQNVTFAVTGPATYRGGSDQLVTAGQPLTYHSPGDHELGAEGGMCKVAIKAQFTPGTVTVTATSPGLTQGTATFEIVPVSNP